MVCQVQAVCSASALDTLLSSRPVIATVSRYERNESYAEAAARARRVSVPATVIRDSNRWNRREASGFGAGWEEGMLCALVAAIPASL